MNFAILAYIIGYVLKIESVLLLLPGFVGLYYGEEQAKAYFIVAAATLLAGIVLSFKRPSDQAFYAREGLISVALSWIAMSLFGCMPFVICGDIPRFADAFFEIVSGFTTTGSSILSDVEALSHCSLFWRSFSHWIGGMGVLVFMLTLFPIDGAAMHIMRAESPGPQVGKIMPKMKDTSKALYIIYSALTALEFVILLACGVTPFDAVTTSFATAGTGGFAIYNSGFADYTHSAQYVVAVFMLLFGVNFSVYFLLIKRHFRQAFKNEELKWYGVIVASAVVLITISTRTMFNLADAFRHAFFQVASIITTTGFSSTDFNLYPSFAKQIIMMLMFIGACAGSTGGGIKVSRITILAKSFWNELARLVHPRTVKKVRFEGKLVEHTTIRMVNVYLVAYIFVYVASLLIISLDDFGMNTNFSAVAATINNIGPGLGTVGPTGNFGGFSDLSKYIFCFDMIAGRLEIFPMLVLLSPHTWHQTIRHRKTANNQ